MTAIWGALTILVALACLPASGQGVREPDYTRELAERRLREMAPLDEAEVVELLGDLAAEDFGTRQRAQQELARVAPLMRKFLEEFRDSIEDPEQRQGIARALAAKVERRVRLGWEATLIFQLGYRGLGAELVGALASAGDSTDVELAITAAKVSADQDEREELIELLGNVIPGVRAGAVHVLHALGGELQAELTPLLADENPAVRFAAVEVLAADSKSACVPVLAELATGDDFYLRWRAADMLRQITAGEVDIDPAEPPETVELGRWATAEGWDAPVAPTAIELLPAGEDLATWDYSPQNHFDRPGIESHEGFLRLSGGGKAVWAYPLRFQNYRLRLDWRFLGGDWKRSDSGLSIGKFAGRTPEMAVGWERDGTIEVQLRPDYSGTFYSNGAKMKIGGVVFSEKRSVKFAPDNEAVAGWNTLEVEERDGTIRVFVNGLLQNEATECSTDLTSLGLRAEGYPIDFRNMTLQPLPGARVGRAPEDQQ